MSSTEQAVAMVAMLAALDTTCTDPERIDEITALERLKTAITARQARLTDAFAVSQRATLIRAGWSDQHTAHQARGWAHRIDPEGAVDRARTAVTDRRVTIRPAPDCMTYVTALLPVKEGVGVYGVLHRAAMTAHCDPDDHRSKGQVMADTVPMDALARSGRSACAAP
ncbi:hypothetical protein [Nakamurella sp.]|uniref:hypothetical protein n=1 Tax=Nakamurella sp. TaxID=1869182 RepID=UPI00378421C9